MVIGPLPRAVLSALLALCAAQASAQTTSSLSGTITDAATDRPIASAEVQVLTPDTTFITLSDTAGRYGFGALPTGIHPLRVLHSGHATALVPEVWVRNGYEAVQDVGLGIATTDLGEVAVWSDAPRTMPPVGSYALTVEQSLRYPATFFDPTRLATTRPGVSGASDQANHFSVRGNGPAANAYLLEGAEIVTPNHLTNAGTVTDLPSLTGGGTNILSAQMLGNSQLRTGGMAANYGNALGGLMDMRLRRGTHQRQAFTLQAGLTGLDVSTEGPFHKGGLASYLVNYRYSTVGLLSDLGVDLGDERIGFQDLSMHIALPLRRGGHLSFFGFGGLSHNYFTAKDSADREVDKDARDIDYRSRMGAAGASLLLPVGGQARWRTTVAISAIDQQRDETERAIATPWAWSFDLLERKVSVVSDVQGRWGSGTTYRIGGSLLQRTVVVQRTLRDSLLPGVDAVATLVRPYLVMTHVLGPHFRAEWGAAYAHDDRSGKGVAEPRASVAYRLQHDRSITFSAGQRSQLDRVQYYVDHPAMRSPAAPLTPMRMREVVLAYDHPFRPHLRLHGEAYFQRVDRIPMEIAPLQEAQRAPYGSMVDLWDEFRDVLMANLGQGKNRGVELGLEHTFHRGLFYQVNATYMDATYQDATQLERPVRWNNSWIGNLIVGREFAKTLEDGKRTWGVNGRFNAMGGLRATPVDLEASREAGVTRYDVDHVMGEQLPVYHRLDVRVYRKRERKGHTGMWSLDLQNLLGTRNTAFRYYDRLQDAVITKYQLGLIPNLSYRIEF